MTSTNPDENNTSISIKNSSAIKKKPKVANPNVVSTKNKTITNTVSAKSKSKKPTTGGKKTTTMTLPLFV